MDKSTKTGDEEYEDLLGYCRVWDIKNNEQFWQKWIAHPKERVRLDIFDELAMYQSREAYCLEAISWMLTMWLHAKKVEEEEQHRQFETLCEAVRYLGKEKIIPLQHNI